MLGIRCVSSAGVPGGTAGSGAPLSGNTDRRQKNQQKISKMSRCVLR
jgi:hypothetical protein